MKDASMRVYIQQIDGKFTDDWVFAAYLGALHLGMEIIFFEEIQEVPKGQFVVSFIEDTIEYFKRTEIKIPPPLNIPEEIEFFAVRDFTKMSLQEFLDTPEITFPVFIKPSEILKGFPSGVLKNRNSLGLIFSDVKNKNQEILVSNIVSMESEYRCFVYKGELVGIKHYQGDFTLFPNILIVKEMIKHYTKCPIAYTLDVAITAENDTILVECNDAWSIGSYGLNETIYIKMLRDRWMEILKTNKYER